MILTTTPPIEGRAILEYKGVVFGEVIFGVNFIRDFKAGIRNIVGGRPPRKTASGALTIIMS